MKKLLYVTCLFLITALSSFSTKSYHSSFSNLSAKKFGTCSAPTNLSAVKNGTSVTLSWTSGPLQHSYGGYYNYRDVYGNQTSANFGGSTSTYPISITVPSTAYSITFTATAYCTDGSYSTSATYTGPL